MIFMFFTDTCFWTHSKLITDKQIYDFRNLLEKFEFGITPQIIKELNHYLPDYLPLEKFFHKPINDQNIQAAQKRNPFLSNFDVADQSLFTTGLLFEDVIINDDRELLAECVQFKITAFHMGDFVLLLISQDIIEKRIGSRIFKVLLEQNIIPNKLFKILNKRLQDLK